MQWIFDLINLVTHLALFWRWISGDDPGPRSVGWVRPRPAMTISAICVLSLMSECCLCCFWWSARDCDPSARVSSPKYWPGPPAPGAALSSPGPDWAQTQTWAPLFWGQLSAFPPHAPPKPASCIYISTTMAVQLFKQLKRSSSERQSVSCVSLKATQTGKKRRSMIA